ncbi:hypothetical protein RS75_20400 [Rhizobium nepotum 39/7]|uniref:Uncharacterized protein n=1 Tax=Rhizobium nepotum 39/7 TaxID=1368418 RepID=A0ABR5CMF3_9HYPH|nr:hypothetical protein RS75_20400 [Rhizobium nepotum 39/7]
MIFNGAEYTARTLFRITCTWELKAPALAGTLGMVLPILGPLLVNAAKGAPLCLVACGDDIDPAEVSMKWLRSAALGEPMS